MNRLPFKINVSIVIKQDDKFLIVKRADDEDVFPGYWGIPGGTVEPEDGTLEAALKRECLEEVGVVVDDFELISNNIVKKVDKAMLYLVYKGSYVDGEPQPLEETSQVEWLTYAEAEGLQLTPFTLEILGTCR